MKQLYEWADRHTNGELQSAVSALDPRDRALAEHIEILFEELGRDSPTLSPMGETIRNLTKFSNFQVV